MKTRPRSYDLDKCIAVRGGQDFDTTIKKLEPPSRRPLPPHLAPAQTLPRTAAAAVAWPLPHALRWTRLMDAEGLGLRTMESGYVFLDKGTCLWDKCT